MDFIKKAVANSFKKPHRTQGAIMWANKYKKPYIATESFIDSFRMVTVKKQNANSHHIIFLHGGAYVHEATGMHRNIIKKFVDLGFRVSFLDYPMAPEYTAATTNVFIVNAYKKLIEQYPSDMFHVFGDSAGGGLALTFLMLLRDHKIYPLPKKSVLMSPWLDISMQNPRIAEHEKKDMILSREGLIYAGKKYAGEIDVKSPEVSPIYGDLDNLGHILMIYSSNEIFVPDFELLTDKIKGTTGTYLTVHHEAGLFHDFILIPWLKKSKIVINMLTDFLLSE